MKTSEICSYCDGQGYIKIRDCSGEVQREETCMICAGRGQKETEYLTEE
jgi:DnaJ-class molecular chaperone